MGGDSTREHPRLILHDFLSTDQCKELEFIHKSCSTVGYRANVLSTTLSHLIATNSAHLIIPLVPIRESLKEKVEEYFGCEFELFIEFTGLISWNTGSSIGWHSDDNRPYLKQRDFAAVCYLNNYGKDFEGGLFHFQDGEPTTFAPSAGDVLIYTADNRNTHSVDEITNGERLTLTLWFTRDISYDEDAKLLSLVSRCPIDTSGNLLQSCLPVPASSNMYQYPTDRGCDGLPGFHICWARLQAIGYDVLCSGDDNYSSDHLFELQQVPLRLARGDDLFDLEFFNILHALQVARFCCWKAPYFLYHNAREYTNRVVQLSRSQRERVIAVKSIYLNDQQAAERLFGFKTFGESGQDYFNWSCFSAAVIAWEDYTCALRKKLLSSLPSWQAQQSIFSVPIAEP